VSRYSPCLHRLLAIVIVMALHAPWQPACAQTAPDAYHQLILAIQQRMDQNDLAGARSIIVSSKSRYPADAGLENLLGVIEIEQGHRESAMQQFSAAMLHDPSLTSAYLNLGRIYSELALTDQAARAKGLLVYRKLLLKDPANAEANYQAAMLLMWDQQYGRSLEHVGRLSAEDRNRVGALVVACADLAALHRNEAADKTATALIAAPDFAEQDVMQLLPALRAARRADLIERLLLALDQRSPLSPAGRRMLGLAQEGEGKLDLARKSLELAYGSDNNSVPVLVDLTRVARAGEDNQAALGYLAHARDLDPGNAGFAYEFGVISLRMGLLGESRKAMAEAVRLDPENAEFNYGMGIVSSFAQDATQGLPYLQKYRTLRPSDPAALLAIGTVWFRAKNYDRAGQWLKQATQHPTTAADAHYYLGRIARVTGHLPEALHELEQANTLAQDRPDILAELGQASIAVHDYSRAQTLLDRALTRDPENYAANFALLQLYARTGDSRREEQSRRFDEVNVHDEEAVREMMRTIDLRPEKTPGN
jgi:tetratricopeptide (TPR) repeat protein